MADVINRPILSVCATVSNRLPELAIKDGQLIFVQDKHKIALDFGGKRVFYNQIEEISTDNERRELLSPVNGRFYFVIDTAILWRYQEKWIQLTTPPKEILFIGTDTFPELGSTNTLYINKNGGISIWDSDENDYLLVADKTTEISIEDIDAILLM